MLLRLEIDSPKTIITNKRKTLTMKKMIIALLGISLVLAACKKDELITYDCTGLTPTYTDDVKQIIDTKCATSGCHDATTKADGYDLSTYATVRGEAGKEVFMGSMQHLGQYVAMPENGAKLNDELLRTVSCWIENGMPE